MTAAAPLEVAANWDPHHRGGLRSTVQKLGVAAIAGLIGERRIA